MMILIPHDTTRNMTEDTVPFFFFLFFSVVAPST